jgi:hypothetical protein
MPNLRKIAQNMQIRLIFGPKILKVAQTPYIVESKTDKINRKVVITNHVLFIAELL